jgi:hypothetical protein
MDQRSICLFLAIKGFSARAVSNNLTAVLGTDAIADSTGTKYLPSRSWLLGKQKTFGPIIGNPVAASPRWFGRTLSGHDIAEPVSLTVSRLGVAGKIDIDTDAWNISFEIWITQFSD